MDPRLHPLAETLKVNTRFLVKALRGLSPEQACRRITPGTNSALYVALHAAESRHFLAGVIGAPVEHPFPELPQSARGLDDLPALPPPDAVLGAWTALGDHLVKSFESLQPARLEEPSGSRFPIDDPTVLGVITFLVEHDSYHTGQVVLLARQAAN